MQKTAQKRGLLNKLKEMTDIGGIAAEKAPFLNEPGFKDVMDKLRYTDDNVRSYVTGEDIGDAAAPDDGLSMKELLKRAESNINRKEYMKAFAELGIFHEKMQMVAKSLKDFDSDVSAIHEKFLMEGLDDETKERLLKLKKRMADRHNKSIVKESGVIDFFANILTQRGRALTAWENRYPKQVKKIKSDIIALYKKSEAVFNVLLVRLKEMATYRATRKVDKFDESSKKIITLYDDYHSKFKEFYGSIKSFLDKLTEVAAPSEVLSDSLAPTELQKPSDKPSMQEALLPIPPTKQYPASIPISLHDKDIVSEPQPTFPKRITPQISISPGARSIPPERLPGLSTPITPRDPVTIQELEPSTIKENPPVMEDDAKTNVVPKQQGTTLTSGFGPKKSHNSFIRSLEALSNENPMIIKNYILRYANLVASSDPDTSRKLLKIASAI